ncbi:hypothetical protein IL252_11370 [Halomicrobium sp. IBSBa]|nr:hypothetical protein [Halomicrobium sp. IBSBa]
MSPEDAWMDGVPLHVHDLEADEVRYHRHTGTVLLCRNGTLVTVVDEDNLRPTTRAAVEFRRDQQ